jgi:hypothetical protein
MAPNRSARNACHRINDCHAFLGRSIAGELRALDRTIVAAAYQIGNATLQRSNDLDQASRAYAVRAVLVLLDLLKRHAKGFAEFFLAYLDLIASARIRSPSAISDS